MTIQWHTDPEARSKQERDYFTDPRGLDYSSYAIFPCPTQQGLRVCRYIVTRRVIVERKVRSSERIGFVRKLEEAKLIAERHAEAALR